MVESDIFLSTCKKIIALSPDVLYKLNPDGVLTFLSDSFEEITGWKKSEWIGRSFKDIIEKDDLPLALEIFTNALQGITSTSKHIRVKSNKKGLLVGDFNVFPDIKNKKIVGVMGIARDITKWKRKEELYRHYADLIESSDSAIYSRNLKGTVLTWNKAAEKLFGYKSYEMIGKNISSLLPQDRKDKVKRVNERLKHNDDVMDFEINMITKSGEIKPVTAKISPIKDSTGEITGAAVFSRDNTEKAAEERNERFLSDATQILSSSFNYNKTLKTLAKLLVPVMADWASIHIIDKKGKLIRLTVAHADSRMTRYVKNYEKKYGSTDNENSGVKRVLETSQSQLYPYISKELIEETIKDEKQKELIILLKIVSAIVVPLTAGKKILGALSVISSNPERLYNKKDLKMVEELGRRAGQAIEHAQLYFEAKKELDRRKEAEKALRQSKEELEVILKSIADGITVQDATGKLTYANDAAAASSGYNSNEDMLKDPLIWSKVFYIQNENGEEINPSDLPGRQAIKERKEKQMLVSFVNKYTTQRRWALIKARPILDTDGRVKAVVNIINDITERQELERRKDDFISIASHELKTPLTSIKGLLYLLRNTLKDSDNQLVILDKIDNQLSRLSLLVKDLLDLSKIREGKLTYRTETINISSLVSDVVSDLQQLTRHKIIFLNGINLNIVGDKDRLSQVFINLLTNAIKYSPNNKYVKVMIDKYKKDIRVRVQDQGIGIRRDEHDKIFERFYRVKDAKDRTFPGHGIGLYFSREVVARHNGKIWVESKKGQGSTFYVTFPIAK